MGSNGQKLPFHRSTKQPPERPLYVGSSLTPSSSGMNTVPQRRHWNDLCQSFASLSLCAQALLLPYKMAILNMTTDTTQIG